MSEQKLVSPLLDGFQMGDPISSHDGVRCCPAIKENSDQKYIIKILSIPASQNQLEALLLTGAFQDAAGALNYFRELSDGVVREAQLHQQLSRLKGFVPCEGWQVVPMDENQLGYDVYLLTPYRRTLERHLKKSPLTHLEAVNLGLDLCAALAACRRAGYIYVDLKPSNIFISDDKEYLIGDLGFISMDSMKYAALPSKYRSRYSAPELHDVFSTISDTADIYALGLILYQVYNDGQLPFDIQPPAEELAPPANADYEMAEIILKACHPDPAQRWQNPTDMGQALVAYMQRNTINDVPILPPVIADVVEEIEEIAAEEPGEAVEETTPETAAEETVEETAEDISEETVPETDEDAADEPAAETVAAETAEEAAPVEEASEEAAESAEISDDADAVSDEVDEIAQALETAMESEEVQEEESKEDAEARELAEVLDIISDEDAPDEEEIQDLDETHVSEEMSAILAQAEELAAMEIPEGVVVHEPKLPEEEPVPEEPEESADEEDGNSGDIEDEDDDEDEDGEDEVDIPIAIPDLEPVKKKGKKWLAIIAILALLAGLAYGANYYYQNYYLVPVESITLEGEADRITADIDVALDESILTAVCTDTYGNTVTSDVVNGKATFEGLKPGMQYTVSLKADGFYKFTGNNTASFTTIRQTNIVSISATTGAEDGSVILSFTVDGTDPENWTVEYTAEGQEPQSLSFTGHMVTITGLTLDTTYSFRLMPSEATDVDVVGTDTLEYTVGKVILAENPVIESFRDDMMTVRWTAPEGAQVSEWTIRCTDGGDYDQTLTVTDCAASFSGTAVGTTYTLEILAQGMTQSVRAEVTPKQLTVTGINCTPVDSATLRVTWEYEGDAPAGGWSVSYTYGSDSFINETTQTNAFDLSPIIPGTTYTIRVADVETTYEAPAAGKFSGHGITADDLTYSTCIAPADSGWNQNDVGTDDYIYTFDSTQKVGLVVYSKASVQADNEDVQVLYLLRYENGTLMDWATRVSTMNWADMWNQNHFCTTIPEIPNDPGTYTVEIYFDGALAVTKQFKIQ